MRPVDSGGPVSIPPVASTPRAPKPPAEVPAPVPGQKYEIQKGDTLWAIAKRAYKVNDHDARGVVDGIAKKNGLSNPDAIATGAFLQLPLPGDLSSFSPAVSKKLVDLQGGATAAVPPAAARPTNATSVP